jgi:ribosomal protein S18 acetylase RimI-like enzyme
MIKILDLMNTDIVKDILELQVASYKIEAELINFAQIPPLMDTIATLQECDEIFYGYYEEEALAGIISYKIYEDALDIHRVAVHPRFFRRGIAGKLVQFIEGLHQDIKKLEVCTGAKNLPAIHLYVKHGFVPMNNIEIAEGIFLTVFCKTL